MLGPTRVPLGLNKRCIDGFLDKKEARPFVAQTLVDMGEAGDFSEEEFEGCFKEFDKDGNG